MEWPGSAGTLRTWRVPRWWSVLAPFTHRESSRSVSHYDDQRRFFEALAGRYDRRFLRARWPRNQELKARVIGTALGSVLDHGPVVEVGCGTAQIGNCFSRHIPISRTSGWIFGIDARGCVRAASAIRRSVRASGGDRAARARAAEIRWRVRSRRAPPRRRSKSVLAELRTALAPRAPVLFLEPNPRFPITAMLGIFEKEERNVLKIGFGNLRRWFEAAGLEHVEVRYGPLYTPPGPPQLVPLLEKIDAAMSRLPALRTLAIFFAARGRVPET